MKYDFEHYLRAGHGRAYLMAKEDPEKYPTRFVTCHCTGTTAYDVMKSIMGDSLEYVHSGKSVIGNNKQ